MTLATHALPDILASTQPTIGAEEAARRLMCSRPALGELILAGDLEQLGRGRAWSFAEDEVDRLAQRRRQPRGALGPQGDRLLFMIRDWGGVARNGELATACRMSPSRVANWATKLSEEALIDRTAAFTVGYQLTREGWEYVRTYAPPT